MTLGRTLTGEAASLLERLTKDPDDVAGHLVLADALSAAGDPQSRMRGRA